MTTTLSTPTRTRRSGLLAVLARTWSALLPVLLALLVGAVVVRATGTSPVAVYRLFAREAFGSEDRVAATLAAATPLVFSALAASVAYRAGVFTLGVEGSFILGGLTAAVVGAKVGGLPAGLAVPVCLAAAALAGAAGAVVPAVLRARFAVDEVVTTLMFNFILIGISGWLVESFLQARGQANSATAYISTRAELPSLAPPAQVNAGLLLAVLLVLTYAVWIRRSARGYEFRMVGLSPRFSAAQGIDVRRVVFLALVMSGVVGGLGGGVHTLGVLHRFVGGFSPGFGFTGVAIALLARFSPSGILLGSVLLGAVSSAGATVQLFAPIPLDLVNVLQGTVMVFAVATIALPRWRRRAVSDGTASSRGAAPEPAPGADA